MPTLGSSSSKEKSVNRYAGDDTKRKSSVKDTIEGKPLPSNLDAEQGLLAACELAGEIVHAEGFDAKTPKQRGTPVPQFQPALVQGGVILNNGGKVVLRHAAAKLQRDARIGNEKSAKRFLGFLPRHSRSKS